MLQRLISSSTAKYLQEAIVTIRQPVCGAGEGGIQGQRAWSGPRCPPLGSTYFIEPMGAVKANNELRELLSKEEKGDSADSGGPLPGGCQLSGGDSAGL